MAAKTINDLDALAGTAVTALDLVPLWDASAATSVKTPTDTLLQALARVCSTTLVLPQSLTVQQPGGTAGVDDLTISNDGNHSWIVAGTGTDIVMGGAPLTQPAATDATVVIAGRLVNKAALIVTTGGAQNVYDPTLQCRESNGIVVLSVEGDSVNGGSYQWDARQNIGYSARNANISFNGGSSSKFQWANHADWFQGTADTALVRLAAGVVGVTNGSSGTEWIQNSAGRARVAADVTNDSDTLADVTGLTVNVKAGRTYSFQVALFAECAGNLEGIRVAVSGTATATDLLGYITINAPGSPVDAYTTRIVSLGDVASYDAISAGSNLSVTASGTITVNAAGTLKIQFAKGTDTGADLTTVKRGSWMWVEDMP